MCEIGLAYQDIKVWDYFAKPHLCIALVDIIYLLFEALILLTKMENDEDNQCIKLLHPLLAHGRL